MLELDATQETAGKKNCAIVLSYSGHLTTLHCAPTEFLMPDSRLEDLSGEVDIDRWLKSVQEKIVEGSLFLQPVPCRLRHT